MRGQTDRVQVPALTSPSLDEPITESRDISNWLCKQQPELVPDEHRETIERLMDQLYSFHAMSLSVPPDDHRHGVSNQAAAMLERADLSDSYRRRLEIKSLFHDQIHSRTLQSDHIEEVEEQARTFVNDVSVVLRMHQNGGPYIFGEKPTILDAHVTALAVRFIDLKRDDLLPDPALRDYALGVMATNEWHRATHGRPTVWNTSLGPVGALDPL
jgi:glutathione S-transferase